MFHRKPKAPEATTPAAAPSSALAGTPPNTDPSWFPALSAMTEGAVAGAGVGAAILLVEYTMPIIAMVVEPHGTLGRWGAVGLLLIDAALEYTTQAITICVSALGVPDIGQSTLANEACKTIIGTAGAGAVAGFALFAAGKPGDKLPGQKTSVEDATTASRFAPG